MKIYCLFECRYSTLVADLKKKEKTFLSLFVWPLWIEIWAIARNIDLLGQKVNLKKKHNSNIAGLSKSVLAQTL